MTDSILEIEKEHFSEIIGNENGSRWSDVIYKGRQIRRITVWCGKFLDAIKVDYDIKLGISSTKHGTGNESQRQTINLHSNDYIQKITGKTYDFYGQVIFTELLFYTEQGRIYGPFGKYEAEDIILDDFSVGGRNCHLLYLDGKCERNEKEQWITQLGFNWEFIIEEQYYSCAMSTTSSVPSSIPSSFKLDQMGPAIYQTMSSHSLISAIHSRPSESMTSRSARTNDQVQLCEMLLRQIQKENAHLRSELENICSISVEKIYCYACSQNDGEKVALSCGHLICRSCFENQQANCPKCKTRIITESAIYLK